jgi:triosephosphate isomerase
MVAEKARMTDRRPMAAGNWKMHKTVAEAVGSAGELAQQVSDVKGLEILIAPSFTALRSVGEVLRGTGIQLAAQNMHWRDEGAFTGEVSPLQLMDVGCTAVLIGHSERRQHFGETDEAVAEKASAAVRHGLLPIVCVGETGAERKAGKTESRLELQIQKGLSGLPKELEASVVIAYEPVWAIGTGVVARPDQIEEAHRFIRGKLADLFGKGSAMKIRILYGGSVTPENIGELVRIEDLDGVLVGGASQKPSEFSRIIRVIADVRI